MTSIEAAEPAARSGPGHSAGDRDGHSDGTAGSTGAGSPGAGSPGAGADGAAGALGRRQPAAEARVVDRWPAEIAVVTLTVVTALSFWRVFAGWSWLPTLIAAGAVAHLLAWSGRRARLPLAAALPATVVGFAIYIGLAWYRSTTWALLPTTSTVRALRSDLAESWRQFATAVPPVAPRGGFLIAAAIGVALIAIAADSLAFRALAGVESILPAALGFTLTSAVGADRHRLIAAALWLAAGLTQVALLRALRAAATGAWLSGRSRSLVTTMRWVGAVVVAALLAALVVGPRLPGYGKSPLVNTRNDVISNRIAVSPLVDIRPRLSNRSTDTAFKVATDTKSYWRLTALGKFDGRKWLEPHSNYSQASGDLPSNAPSSAYTRETTQVVTIGGLTEDFVPTAYLPTSVSASRAVRWDATLQSLITAKGQLHKGDTFTMTALLPDPAITPEMLRAAPADVPPEIEARYLDIPDNVRARLLPLAREHTQNAATPYDQARLLQDWFRTAFTYSLNVPSGSSLNAIDAFLTAKRGYCEQFAGTFAAMARSLGIPSRVAVGFTYGKKQSDGSYLVQGMHAHAWPEIFLSGFGWLAFEPTPGRGNPDATSYTGVGAEEAGEPRGTSASTGSTIAPISPNITAPAFPTIPPGELGPDGNIVKPKSTTGGRSIPAGLLWAGGIGLALVVIGGAWLWGIAALTRRRWAQRRRLAGGSSGLVVLAWHRVVDALRRAGRRVDASETPTELAQRVGGSAGLDGNRLTRLADLTTVAGFSGVDLDDALATEATTIADELVATVHASMPRGRTWRLRLDPLPLLRPLPGDADRVRRDAVTAG